MITKTYFNNAIFIKTIVAFLDQLSGYTIQRMDQNDNISYLTVPIIFAHPENYLARLQDENNTIKTNFPLPTMALEVTDFHYANNRKLSKTAQESIMSTNQSQTFLYTPIPYDLSFKLSILSKTYFDLFQIIEQILPKFTPDLNLNIYYLGPQYNSDSIPFVLTSVNFQPPGDLSIGDQRLIEIEIDFLARTNLYLPTQNQYPIDTIYVNAYNIETYKKLAEYTITSSGSTVIEFTGV